jgi:hypothetical protein
MAPAPAPAGALPNLLSKELFSVKNKEAEAILEEPQFMTPPIVAPPK